MTKFRSDLRAMRARIVSARRVAPTVVQQAAPALTAELRAAHAAGVNPYGQRFGTNADGTARTLRRTGALGASLQVVAQGAGLRAVVGASYGRFYAADVLPGAQGLPVRWSAQIARVASKEFDVRLGGRR